MKKIAILLMAAQASWALPTNICVPVSSDPATQSGLTASGIAALATMQGLITRIGTDTVPGLCVPVPPVTPSQLALCSSMVATYSAAVTTISQPCTVEMSLQPAYLANPFDPCKFVVSGMLGDGVYCPLTTYSPLPE